MTFAITMRKENINGTIKYTLPEKFITIFNKLNCNYLPVSSLINIDNVLKQADVLILTGSPCHVNPKLYNKESEINFNYDNDEDQLDYELIKKFNNANKPILGICRGIQVLNVYFGGTLKQKISNHEGVRHNIKINKDSILYNIYKESNINVNSTHTQCIDTLASGFKISALSDDNIIEGIEKDNIIGIQFHPEKDLDYKFFAELIKIYQK